VATVDLDIAATELMRRVTEWRSAGFVVADPTWRDQGDGWPPQLKTDRSPVVRPDSIGVAVRHGIQEGEVVLFDGGWCDVTYWSGNPEAEPYQAAPGHPGGLTVDGYADVLDSFIRRFT
jgi:hypothetical protein